MAEVPGVRGASADRVVLAHMSVSRLRAPLSDPSMRSFSDVFASLSDAAEQSPGFCWQLASRRPGEPVIDKSSDGLLMVSLSCWKNYASLNTFVYRGAHASGLREHDNWFVPVDQPATVLWWVGAGSQPTVAEGRARLAYLRAHGSTPRAFSTLRRFTPEGRPERTGRFRAE